MTPKAGQAIAIKIESCVTAHEEIVAAKVISVEDTPQRTKYTCQIGKKLVIISSGYFVGKSQWQGRSAIFLKAGGK